MVDTCGQRASARANASSVASPATSLSRQSTNMAPRTRGCSRPYQASNVSNVAEEAARVATALQSHTTKATLPLSMMCIYLVRCTARSGTDVDIQQHEGPDENSEHGGTDVGCSVQVCEVVPVGGDDNADHDPEQSNE